MQKAPPSSPTPTTTHTTRPRVLIAGAGFAGLWAARTLANEPVDVTIVDRNNYHTFLPLLYQVAAAELEPEQIAYPVRGIFRGHENIDFAMAEITGLDTARRVLHTESGELPYDYLLLAPGSVNTSFGVPGVEEYCFALKDLEQGITLRNHIISCFERASVEPDPVTQRQLMTFTVVGGGPTGVEYAGTLAELIRGPLAKDYPKLNISQARVVLIEGLDGVLAGFPDPLRRNALTKLGKKGVEVRLSSQVARVTPEAVHMEDGSAVYTETVVWTAGVVAPKRLAEWGLPTGRAGRVLVRPTLQVQSRQSNDADRSISPDDADRSISPDDADRVFVAGDAAWVQKDDVPLPMVAPVAMQQGKHAARSILTHAAGGTPSPFVYFDKGSLATIGRGAAVAHVFGRNFTGLPAWVLWLFVHLMYLVGFRNRLIVLINWASDYFLFERAVRLILPRDRRWLTLKRRFHRDEDDNA